MKQIHNPQHLPVYLWLVLCLGMVVSMIVIGAITRLTDSGLSMVEWRPLYGFLPPLNDAEWQRIFALYKQIPEYRYQNLGMDLAGFKQIFFWEYFHRLWGRLIGIVYFFPLCYFWWRGQLFALSRTKLVILLLLGGLQGIIGWWMVKSGLSERLDVSAFRLMIHLGCALVIMILLWGLVQRMHQQCFTQPNTTLYASWISPMSHLVLALVFTTILSGALVAGNDAGLVYNDWPYMNGKWVAAEYDGLSLTAWLEEPATVQFHHRIIAYISFILVIGFAIFLWRDYRRSPLRSSIGIIFITMIGQLLLGIATLMSVGNTILATCHHANAILLLLAVCRTHWLVHHQHH